MSGLSAIAKPQPTDRRGTRSGGDENLPRAQDDRGAAVVKEKWNGLL